MSNTRREMGDTDWRLFKNTTNEEIPHNAYVEIHGSVRDGNKSAVLHGRKQTPGGKAGGFNGPTKVAPGGFGRLTTNVGYVFFDNAESPATGEEWGPVAGEWKIKKSGTGIRILGPIKGERVRAKIGIGGGGEQLKAFVGKTVDTIPARVDDNTPGTASSSAVDTKAGSIAGSLHNWSSSDITSGYFVSGLEVDGNTIIIDVWC